MNVNDNTLYKSYMSTRDVRIYLSDVSMTSFHVRNAVRDFKIIFNYDASDSVPLFYISKSRHKEIKYFIKIMKFEIYFSDLELLIDSYLFQY